jgi:hypothetical protein
MKVGDLVSLKMKKTQPPQDPQFAVVLVVDADGDGSVRSKVAWQHSPGRQTTLPASYFEVLSETR